MNNERRCSERGAGFAVPCTVLVWALALGLTACSKEEPPKVAPPAVVQPAAQPEAKAGEIRSETSAPAPEPMTKIDPNAELAGKVKSALRAAPGLGDLAVDVVASDGAVTLFGTADTRANVEQAGKVASEVPGVKSVQNKIVVVRGS
jgi:hyperosmotically inducible periplasmic protein